MTKKITFEEFNKIYEIKRHPFMEKSPYENTMLDFTDEELDYLIDIPNNNIWSLKDGIKTFKISSGLSYDNIVGFFITKKSWINKIEYLLK